MSMRKSSRWVSRLKQVQERDLIRRLGAEARESIAAKPGSKVQSSPSEPGRPEEWRELSKALREERGCRCERCGRRFNRIDLECHHVLPWSTHPRHRYDPENLLVLCHRCHEAFTQPEGHLVYASLPKSVQVRILLFLKADQPDEVEFIEQLEAKINGST
jgi:hypothetical protein